VDFADSPDTLIAWLTRSVSISMTSRLRGWRHELPADTPQRVQRMLTVRCARTDERDEMVDVWLAANAARGRVAPVVREERVREKLSDPVSLPIVALERALVVGMALGEPGRHDDGRGALDPSLLHVSMVFVRPDRWGLGVGRTLLDGLFGDGRELGFRRASLWTGGDNDRARRLYDRCGMQLTGARKKIDAYGVVVQYGIELASRRIDVPT
jgi:ribosomal protein S18 acetylase RimI-like enzyme